MLALKREYHAPGKLVAPISQPTPTTATRKMSRLRFRAFMIDIARSATVRNRTIQASAGQLPRRPFAALPDGTLSYSGRGNASASRRNLQQEPSRSTSVLDSYE